MRTPHFLLLLGAICCLIPARAAEVPPRPQLVPASFGATNGSPHDFGSLRWLTGLTNLITNGNFDGGSLAGWQLEASAYGVWTGTNAPPGGDPLFQGGCALIARAERTYQAGPALVQTVTLPRTATSAVLAWDDLRRTTGVETPSSVAYTVEVRDLQAGTVQVVASAPLNRTISNTWQTRSADLSAWIGRTVQLAWVAQYVALNRDTLALDNVRLETGPVPGVEFAVYQGAKVNYAPTNLLALTSDLTVPLPLLRSVSSNQWTVVARMNGQTNGAPVASFQLASRSRDLLALSVSNRPVVAGQPLPLQFRTQREPNAPSAYFGTFTVSARGEKARQPGVLITEVRFSATNGVELMNVGPVPVNIGRWIVELYSGGEFVRGTFPANYTVAPGALTTISAGRPIVREGPDFQGLIPDLIWKPTDRSRAVLLREPTTNGVMDAVIQGDRGTFDVQLPGAYAEEWVGATVTVPSWFSFFGSITQTLRRVGRIDSNSRLDWMVAAGDGTDFRLPNPELPLPMGPGPGRFKFQLSSEPRMTNGLWAGTITFAQAADQVVIEASRPGAEPLLEWPRFDVQAAPRLDVIAPATLTEGADGPAVPVTVRLQTPATVPTRVKLTATPPGRLGLPAEVEIPSGESTLEVPVTLANDSSFQGTVEVTITPQADGWEAVPATVMVLDDEPAVPVLELPATLAEGATGSGLLIFPAPSAFDHWVELASDRPELRVPARVLVPAGGERQVFRLAYPEEPFVGTNLVATVTAWSGQGGAAQASLTLVDNDPAQLRVEFGQGNVNPLVHEAFTYRDGAKVVLSGPARDGVTVRFRSTDPSVLLLDDPADDPAQGLYFPQVSVGVPAGKTFGLLTYNLPDNDVREGRRTAQLVTEAPGWAPTTNTVTVTDNEVASITVEAVPSPQYSGAPAGQPPRWLAWSIDGDEIFATATTPVSYSAGVLAADGRELVSPRDAGALNEGLAAGFLTFLFPGLTAPELGARIVVDVAGVRGLSQPFNILPGLRRTNLLDWAADLVAVPNEVKALVSVRAGTYQNQVVEVDFATDAVRPVFTPPLALKPDTDYLGGGLAITPDGKYALVIAGQQAQKAYVFRRADGTLEKEFDLPVDTVYGGAMAAAVPSPDDPWHFVVRLQAPAVLALRPGGSQLLENLPVVDFVPSPDDSQLHAVVATFDYQARMVRLTVQAGAVVVENLAGPALEATDDWAAVDHGFVSSSLRELSSGLAEVFPAFYEQVGDKVRWLAWDRDLNQRFIHDGARLAVYDAQRNTPRVALGGLATPTLGSRGLALVGPYVGVMSGQTLVKVSLPLVLPDAVPADLALTVSRADPGPLMPGQEAVWNVDVTNHGPGPATDVRVVFESRQDLTMVGAQPLLRALQQLVQNEPLLPAGASRRYLFRGTPQRATALPYSVFTYANEADPVAANDGVSVVETVAVPPATLEASGFNELGQFLFWVRSATAGSYRLEVSSTLLEGAWTPLVTDVTPFLYVEETPAGTGPRYFRAVAQP